MKFAAAFLAGLMLVLLPHLALGQGAQVYQNGTMVPGHIAKFVTQGRIADVGGILGDTAGLGVSPFAVTDKNALGICSNSAATTGPFSAICLGHDAAGNALLSVSGGAHLLIDLNGASYEFPVSGSGTGNVVGPLASTLDYLTCWNSTAGTMLKDCATVHGPLKLQGVIAGPETSKIFVDVLTVNADTSTASFSPPSDPGKFNAIGAYNTFGSGSTVAAESSRTGLFAKIQQNGPVAYTSIRYNFITGMFPYVTVPQGNSVPAQAMDYTAAGGLVEVGGTTQVYNLEGAEFDVAADINTNVDFRIGIAAVAGAGTIPNRKQGFNFDGAFTVENDGGVGGENTWRLGYAIAGPNGLWPYHATTSEIIGAMPGTLVGPVGTGIDFRAVTTFGFAQYWSKNFMIDPGGRIIETTTFPAITMRETAVGVAAGGLVRWESNGAGAWLWQINTAPAGDFTAAVTALQMQSDGQLVAGNTVTAPAYKAVKIAGLPAPGAGFGGLAWVAGTSAGTCKLIGVAGTSATPVTVVDNVGAGC